MALRRIAVVLLVSSVDLAGGSRVVVDGDATMDVEEVLAEEAPVELSDSPTEVVAEEVDTGPNVELIELDHTEEAAEVTQEKAKDQTDDEDEDATEDEDEDADEDFSLAEELLNSTGQGVRHSEKRSPLEDVCPGELCPMECRCLSGTHAATHSTLRASGHISEPPLADAADGQPAVRHRTLDMCAAVRGQRSQQRRVPEVESCDERCDKAGMHGSRCLSRGKCECVVFGRQYTWETTDEWEVQSTFPWIPQSAAERDVKAPFQCYGTCRRLCSLQHGRGTPWACAWPDNRLGTR